MKTLPLFLCAALAASITEAAQRSPRSVEFIIPTSTNLFVRTSNNVIIMGPVTNRILTGSITNGFVRTPNNVVIVGATTNEIFVSTNRFGNAVVVGSTNRLNVVRLSNAIPSRSSVLVGPVFPGPTPRLTSTGRPSSFEALGVAVGPGLIATNVVGPTSLTSPALSGLPTPDIAVPFLPVTTILAPPTPPSAPRPATPSAFPNPSAPQGVPLPATPTPPGIVPLTPPGGVAAPAPPRPPPPASAGRTR